MEDHAALGDGRTVALVDRSGTIDWLPLPGLDASPMFARLLDETDGGCIELAPVAAHRMTRCYVAGTNVLETRYETEHGVAVVRDALVTGVAGRLPWAELVRRVEGVDGRVVMAWRVAPGTAFGTRSPWIADAEQGVIRAGDLTLGVVTGNVGTPDPVDHSSSDALGARFRTSPGSVHVLGLSATEREPLHLPDPLRAGEAIDRTIDGWRTWSKEFAYDGPWRETVQRSALALKLLIHAPYGSIAAAATTSLPETDSGGKNWDYRFAWVRDLAYTVGALVQFGLREETHAALSWLLRAIKASAPDLQIFYRLDGSVDGEVTEHPDTAGWNGLGPVVTGNPAKDQLQLGVYGDLFGIVRAYVAEADGNVLDVGTGELLADLADRVCDSWRSRDSGMWELPETQHHTSSKMGCWQALDAAIDLAERGQIVDRRARWVPERERIRDWIGENCWDERRGAYTMWPGSTELDVSVLLHAPSGFDRGERMSRTIDALDAELGAGRGRLWRYSGMREEEHPFVACGFWATAALACVGRVPEARERMDSLVSDVNDVGLLAEMVTVDGAFRGNFPQALSHLALIDAAIKIRDLG
ncbi:glycoside hydrolase family 15 protein [Schumannella sp. 10F1B-5-1]|nr:glycoside hydrolase family 15 protein [Schumannella sp. 10F1B-5-1]TPW78531.1 glycoside hydrolase family 15 protein [Schumannella sp. 10F1B-5-1]